MKQLVLAMTVVLLWAAPAAAGEETLTAKCLLEIDGETYISGTCPVVLDDEGSFTLGADGKTAPEGYFAMVLVSGKNIADAYWNEAPASTHAQGSLGEVTRHGACWSNARAKICAWR
jgi:hypothetical protein